MIVNKDIVGFYVKLKHRCCRTMSSLLHSTLTFMTILGIFVFAIFRLFLIGAVVAVIIW